MMEAYLVLFFSRAQYPIYLKLSFPSFPILPVLILPIINYPAHPSHSEYPEKNPPFTMSAEFKKN